MQYDYSQLKGCVIARSLTLETLASKIGVSPSTMYRKFANLSLFNQDEIIKIASALSIRKKDIPVYFFREKLGKSQVKEHE